MVRTERLESTNACAGPSEAAFYMDSARVKAVSVFPECSQSDLSKECKRPGHGGSWDFRFL